ncbi:hypothetical protein VP01_1467g6 [Puccinia sorghi]|uniref:Tet-like 2OG-Fe(II) oxygenase domain-containing protein n=1 Tax=Puccinia sorghi TaxID=27349 RepID=A0A0L6VJR4_9BASI|nr:hypothetical protein VP01_1467g5 [Puccinia sorghi]KNZ61003.1 hypothetical protein VP01_1467g6 [Puccinia sorghi]
MNMLGWQKCMNKDEKVDLYLSVEKISKDINQFTCYDPVTPSGTCQGFPNWGIISSLHTFVYPPLANNAFQKNHEIMAEHQVPDFGYPKLHTSEGNNSSAASLEKQDSSEFAFAQWIPTFSKTGKVSTHAQGFNVQGEQRKKKKK